MHGLIYDFFKLILPSFTNLILDYIHESLRFSKTAVDEDFEFFSSDKLSGDTFYFLFILLLMI